MRFRILITLLLVTVLAPVQAQESVVVFPNAFRSYLLESSGASELDPDDTAAARQFLDAAARASVETSEALTSRVYPTLTALEQDIVDEHVALFEANAVGALQLIQMAGLKEKAANPEYSIGPGLAFLAEQGHGDKALIFTGSKEFQSGGRLFLSAVRAAVTGYSLSPGASGLLAGIVDLRTGEIEWMYGLLPLGPDVRKAAGADRAMYLLMKRYPDRGLYTRPPAP